MNFSKRGRLVRRIGGGVVALAALGTSVAGLAAPASAQSTTPLAGVQCGYRTVYAIAPTISGDQAWVNRFTGARSGGTAYWISDLMKYNTVKRTWDFVARSGTLSAEILGTTATLGATTGYAGPTWYYGGRGYSYLTWNVTTPGAYAVINHTSDGGGWVSAWSTNSCAA
jgi:hypothetical protein